MNETSPLPAIRGESDIEVNDSCNCCIPKRRNRSPRHTPRETYLAPETTTLKVATVKGRIIDKKIDEISAFHPGEKK